MHVTQNIRKSYSRQAEDEAKVVGLPSCFSRPGSNDAWRHRRMLDLVLPFISEFPEAEWMTIGDGNHGSDAYYLSGRGVQALATSISDATLKTSRDLGYIADYRVENAESLTADDESVDFTLCKEAYHHFPRPAIAFYEMVRAARKGVVLIEPCDGPPRLFDRFKNLVKKIIRRDVSTQFESSGNFIFRLEIREIKKMMTAMNYPCVVYRPFNDFYHPRLGGEFRPLSLRTQILRLGIAVQDVLCALGLMNHGLACVVALKSLPSPGLRENLRKSGYRVSVLPKNPFL